MEDVYGESIARLVRIQELLPHATVHVIWEHELKKQCKADAEFSLHMDTEFEFEAIAPRKALKGLRAITTASVTW